MVTENTCIEMSNSEKMETQDILGNGTLTKTVLVEGKPDSRPAQGDWVEVSYVMKKTGADDVLAELHHAKICLMDNDVVPGVDLALLLMNEGEQAKLFVSAERGYGISGRASLKIKPSENLDFVITLHKKVEVPEAEEFAALLKIKQENAKQYLLSSKDHCEPALYIYKRLLRHLESRGLEKSVEAYTMRNNAAQCCLNLEDYPNAALYARDVLLGNPDNTKALLRLGKAYHYLGDFAKAEKVLAQGASLEPNNRIIINELNVVKTKHQKSLEKQKKTYGRMFGLDKPKEDKPKQEKKKEKKEEGNLQYYVAGALMAVGVATFAYTVYNWFRS